MIKDPSIWGLMTGAGYAVTILATALAAMKDQKAARKWIAASFILIALCIVRILGLQIQVAELGREAAREAGLYGNRDMLQTIVMLGIAVTAFVSAGFAIVRVRLMSPLIGLAVLGLLIIVIVNAARAVSLHRADEMLQRSIGPLNLGLAIENIGLFIVLAAAGCVVLKRSKRKRRRR